MSGTLYIVSTPIGNPEDISLRALRILGEVALILAEDASVTRRLLHSYAITTEVVSYRPRRKPLKSVDPSLSHFYAGASKTEEFPGTEGKGDTAFTGYLHSLLSSGKSVALVCDAGTPTLADPGNRLIAEAIAWGAPIMPVPGPSAALAALVVSGLPPSRFAFEGFPPRTRADRQAFFTSLRSETRTLILYETRRYLRSTIQALIAALGPERSVVVARNLTMPSESLFRGDLVDALAFLLPDPPRGEYVLIVGNPSNP